MHLCNVVLLLSFQPTYELVSQDRSVPSAEKVQASPEARTQSEPKLALQLLLVTQLLQDGALMPHGPRYDLVGEFEDIDLGEETSMGAIEYLKTLLHEEADLGAKAKSNYERELGFQGRMYRTEPNPQGSRESMLQNSPDKFGYTRIVTRPDGRVWREEYLAWGDTYCMRTYRRPTGEPLDLTRPTTWIMRNESRTYTYDGLYLNLHRSLSRLSRLISRSGGTPGQPGPASSWTLPREQAQQFSTACVLNDDSPFGVLPRYAIGEAALSAHSKADGLVELRETWSCLGGIPLYESGINVWLDGSSKAILGLDFIFTYKAAGSYAVYRRVSGSVTYGEKTPLSSEWILAPGEDVYDERGATVFSFMAKPDTSLDLSDLPESFSVFQKRERRPVEY